MIIYPAIDLYDGKAVRLYKGDYEQMTVYSENPPEIAEAFAKAGATHMHVVDLEGAKSGIIRHIHRDPLPAAQLRHMAVDFPVIGGSHHKFRSFVQIRVPEGPLCQPDSRQIPDRITDLRCHQRDPCAEGQQLLCLSSGDSAAPHHKNVFILQIHKQWKI